MRLLAVGLALAIVPAIGSASHTRARYLMGTVCEITASDASRIDAAFDEAKRIEGMLSTWTDTSELAKLNAAATMTVSAELVSLLENAVSWGQRTGGAFNPLVAPLIDAWKSRGHGALPVAVVRDAALARVKLTNVWFGEDRVLLKNGAQFEEGGFGKGYALDRMLPLLADDHAMIDFGGQLAVRGSHEVTIADPKNRQRPIVSFTLTDASLSTSSGSEKTFVVDGKRLTHILDPRSGDALPPRGSVSVIAKSAFEADVLSTALYVMGVDEGLRWADTNRIAALFITPENELRLSTPFRALARDLTVLDTNFKSTKEQ